MAESGDHKNPANWKEDARLAWKFVSVLTSICAFALIVAGWGFKVYAESLQSYTFQTERSALEAVARVESLITEHTLILRSHMTETSARHLDHERRITRLETLYERRQQGANSD